MAGEHRESCIPVDAGSPELGIIMQAVSQQVTHP